MNDSLEQGTEFDDRCYILGQFFVEYKAVESFSDFFSYNDLGLPLAYLIASNIVEATPKAQQIVNETFDMLLAAFDVEDSGYETLDDIIVEDN